jgi:HemX protein
MKLLSQFLSYILPVFYLCAIYIYYVIFSGKRKNLESKTLPILTGLLILHGAEIAIRLASLRVMPFSTAFDALSFLAFSILFIYLIIESSIKNKGSGLFILSFAFVLQLISSFNHTWEAETNELLSSPTFTIHASLTIMGYTALSISAIYALMYIIHHQNMKKRRFGAIYQQMPPLNLLESMSIRSVAIGVILLGLGIFMGHVQANTVLGSFWISDPKVIISDIIWILYAASYALSRALKLRGRWMAYLSVSGYLILITSGIVLFTLTESFHKFY